MKELPLIDFIKSKWLEITCGEAPYMVNRYDMETGEVIPLKERSGFIDAKFKKLNQEIESEKEWIKLAVHIYKASYGYEYQGDSLLLARENLILTFIDNYFYMFGAFPKDKVLQEITKIISLNVFQMDGLTYEVPYSDGEISNTGTQLSLFEEIEAEEESAPELAKIKLWDKGQVIEFKKLSERNEPGMKFDVVIGNPPYQDVKSGERLVRRQIYDKFYDAAEQLSQKYILISPARFLSNQGGTPKKWNEKMLNNSTVKIIEFFENSNEVFQNTDIKGGIVILYHDKEEEYEIIGTFIPDEELNSAYKKINSKTNKFLNNIVFNAETYRYTEQIFEDYPDLIGITKPAHRLAVTSNTFGRYSPLYQNTKPMNGDYLGVYGRENNQRVYKWIDRKYIQDRPNMDKWKVILPGANGSGNFGETISDPIVGEPGVIHNQTFISIGTLNTEYEANSLLKYIKSKFLRSMLGILKTTQNNQSPRTWSKIPLHDFTQKSDIDWSKSISEIDQQLYEKYGLTEEEINFIETNVKEME